MKPMTRDELIEHLLDHQMAHPEKNWPIEIRDRWLVHPPALLEHCDIDRVIILRGEAPICLIRPDRRG